MRAPRWTKRALIVIGMVFLGTLMVFFTREMLYGGEGARSSTAFDRVLIGLGPITLIGASQNIFSRPRRAAHWLIMGGGTAAVLFGVRLADDLARYGLVLFFFVLPMFLAAGVLLTADTDEAGEDSRA